MTVAPKKPRPGSVVIVGVGLIGGSLGLALRAAGACGEVVGCDASPLDEALERGAIDRALPLTEAARIADVVVLATPVRAMPDLARQIAPLLRPDAVVTDTGSVKGQLVRELTPLLGARYVPAHPIAGRERSGVAAADAALFSGASCVLTPPDGCDPAALAQAGNLWQQAGCRVLTMTPELHDRVFGWVSHLPHLVAFALMETVYNARTDEADPAEYAAGGLRDFTRVAGSDPVMWRDIFLSNRQAVLAASAALRAELERLETAIRDADGATLLDTFTHARHVRERITTRP